MEYEFNCKCGCKNFMGPYNFDAENPIVICPNCYKSVRCTDDFLKNIRTKKRKD